MKKLMMLGVLLCSVAFGATSQGHVFYEIFVRSFQDSDGDGVGDLKGATSRLDYLQELGVKGVWLMPVHDSPSYHGYDVTDYLSIHPDYGTMEDFEAFVAAAHERDMEVILDLVVNHTSSEHPWFKRAEAGEAAYRDYYVFRDDDPGWRGLGGSAFHPSGEGYYLGLFWSEMPDLNYENPQVLRDMQGVARFWLDKGVDGFRVDAVQHIVESESGFIANTPENFAWVEAFGALIKSIKPDAYLVGETWTDSDTIARYVTDFGLDYAFNYPLFFALTSAVQDKNPAELKRVLGQDVRLYPQSTRFASFISNHDQIRPGTALGFLRRDEARLRLAAGLLLTLPGTPYLYYGEELGLPNGPGDADEEKRTPMMWDLSANFGFTEGAPWYAFSSDDPELTVAAQRQNPDSLLNHYKALIALRSVHPALAAGTLTLEPHDNPDILAYTREHEGARFYVVANFGDEVTLELGARRGATERLSETPVGETLSLGALELAILELP